MSKHIAVDLGATSGRVSVGTVQNEAIDLVELARFNNIPLNLAGVPSWDTSQLFDNTVEALRVAVRPIQDDSQGATSIGIDSWGVDYGLLRPGVSQMVGARHYRGAAAAAVRRVHDVIPPIEAYRRTGIEQLPINTIYQLAAAAERGEIDGDAVGLLIPDLWVYYLTGDIGAELTIASTTGMLGITEQDWAVDLIEPLGIPRTVLPPLRPTGSSAGYVTPSRLKEIGSPAPLEVFRVAEHDTASAILSLPVQQSFAFISCGSWALVGQEIANPVLTEEARLSGFTNEQGPYGTILLLRNLSGLWLLEECVREWNDEGSFRYAIPKLLEQAREVGGLPSVIDVSDPDFLQPGDLTERIRRHCRESGQVEPSNPVEVTRCLIDSLALAYRETIQESERLSGRSAEVIHIIGGGSKNALLCQMTADACQKPVLAGPAEATSLGNVLSQAISVHELEDVTHARSVVRNSISPLLYNPSAGADTARLLDAASYRLRGLHRARRAVRQ